MRIRRVGSIGLIVAIGLSLAACAGDDPGGPGSSEQGSLRKVSLRLDWLWGSEHAPYFVALEKGYFEDEGLDVEILEGEGSTVSAKLVANGSNDFGVVAAGTVIASVSQELPLKTVATLFQSIPTAIAYGTDDPIDDLSDLHGKKLGVVTDSVTYNEWGAVADLNEVDRGQIDEVSVGENVVQAMLADRVDATVVWTFNQGLEIRLNGGEIDFLTFSDLGLDVPGSTIVANSELIEENPEVVDGFVDAVVKGWEDTLDDPEGALEAFYSYHDEVDHEYNDQKLPLVLELVPSDEGLGFSREESWTSLRDLYEDAELLGSDISPSDAYTNEFVGN
jgi:NitT/TauT family transport system substrate-binding protein